MGGLVVSRDRQWVGGRNPQAGLGANRPVLGDGRFAVKWGHVIFVWGYNRRVVAG